jgi:hypothetical protein
MGLSREELFQKAKELRKKEKEEKNNKESFSGEDYEGVVYTSLPTEGIKIFRIYGDPLAIRSKPTDPKRSYISMILADNGKKFRCIFPSREEDKNWILWRIFDTVMESSWEKNEDGKSVRKYKHEKTHPECFRRVAKNNSDNKFEGGWYPPRYINMNILDRHDPEYHIENKHSKLLSKRASEIGDSGNFWYDPGIAEAAYNAIWDDVVEYSGQWDNYDVGLKKETDSPWYRAFHGVDDLKKISQIDPDAANLVVEGPMTEEEKNYELYDLDRLFKVTSYTKIKAKLGDFIKKVDIDFKKNFYEELEALVAKEQEEWKANEAERKSEEPKKEKTTKAVEEKKAIEEKKAEVPAPTLKSRVVQERKTTAKVINWDALADGSFNGKKYLGVSEMSDDEKSMVISVREDGSFEYVNSFNGVELDLMNNPSSNFISPDLFHVDPLSGDIF